MRLTNLELESFRGIGHLIVDLGPTTVLLGENRVGKTTVVDAIDCCLAASRTALDNPFVPGDLRRGSERVPIRLTLTFAEDDHNEWDRPELDPLRPVFQPGPFERRWIRLRLTGAMVSDVLEHSWEFLDGDDRPLVGEPDLELVEHLRRLNPCLVLAANRYYQEPAAPHPPLPGQTAQHDLKRTVEGVYRRACQTRGGLSRKEILAGLTAARELEDEHVPFEESESRAVRDMVETPRELSPLDWDPEEEVSLSAQNMALLILVGSLLQARGQNALLEEATPLVVIEEPEAHLHPILAASLWGTLQRLPAQRVITTNSGELLAAAPLFALRRLSRKEGETRIHQLGRRSLKLEEQRRVGYHVRVQRGASLFARCWLLVEGETESWLLPELARMCGYVLASEGVAIIEFAQCGVHPLIKLADALGIEWHLLADGDEAGQVYIDSARGRLHGRPEPERITRLEARNVEQCLWAHGYADVFRSAAVPQSSRRQRRMKRRARRARKGVPPRKVIRKAIKRHSKPFLALRVLEAAAESSSPGVPPVLRRAIEAAVGLARSSNHLHTLKDEPSGARTDD